MLKATAISAFLTGSLIWTPASSQTKSKAYRWLLEPVIVGVVEPVIAGVVSGFVAARAAESYAASSKDTIPRYWRSGDQLEVPRQAIGYDQNGKRVSIAPGTYRIFGEGEEDGIGVVVFEDKKNRILVGAVWR